MSLSGEVLIVDDAPVNLRMLSVILQAEGLQVRLAANGTAALRSVATRAPDLILLDIHMPELDGFETCRRLRNDPDTHDIPVLFLSSSQEPEERLQAFASGGLDFIVKPFHADEVLARVSTHLTLARLRAELAVANFRLSEEVVRENLQRRQAEDMAHERQVRLDFALAAAGIATWSADDTDGCIQLDAEAMAMLGTRTAVLHGGWGELLAGFDADDRPALADGWQHGMATGEVFELDGWWTGGEERRRVRLRGRMHARPDGARQVLGLLWDISHEHTARQRLAHSERLESLGRMAGSLAHDFNNHLTVILANLDLLRRVVSGEPRISERLACIDGAAMTATSLIRDLMTFARQREVRLEPLRAATVVTDLRTMLTSLLGRGIAIRIAAANESLSIIGSREQLQNAVLNLCLNARDAMPNGGTLTLAVNRETVTSAPCRICTEEVTGTFAAITVCDEGCGIPLEIQNRIFEPFFTTKGEGSGTGLGLATVIGCVKSHGGHLLFSSKPGAGTIFRILLPLVAEDGDAA